MKMIAGADDLSVKTARVQVARAQAAQRDADELWTRARESLVPDRVVHEAWEWNCDIAGVVKQTKRQAKVRSWPVWRRTVMSSMHGVAWFGWVPPGAASVATAVAKVGQGPVGPAVAVACAEVATVGAVAAGAMWFSGVRFQPVRPQALPGFDPTPPKGVTQAVERAETAAPDRVRKADSRRTALDSGQDPAKDRHDLVLVEYARYESSPVAVFAAPLLADVRCERTAGFHDAMREAYDARCAVEAGHTGYAGYAETVRRLEQAWRAAQVHAELAGRRSPDEMDAGRDPAPERDRRLQRALAFARVAEDPSAEPAERMSALTRALRAADGLVTVPVAARNLLAIEPARA